MKMSESFSLPVKAKYERDYCDEYVCSIYDSQGDILLSCIDDDVDAEAIEASINMHDELVEAVKEMRDFAVRQGWEHVLINKCNKLLEKAKS